MRPVSILMLLLFALALIPSAIAVCPICTVAVGAGVGVLRTWGVDDLITSLWFGALVVSSIAWTLNVLHKRGWLTNARAAWVAIGFLAIFIGPLPFMGVMGVLGNAVYGIDKFLIGTILGMIVFLLAVRADKYLRSINEEKVLVPYQKVIIPVVFLTIISTIIFLLLKLLR